MVNSFYVMVKQVKNLQDSRALLRHNLGNEPCPLSLTPSAAYRAKPSHRCRATSRPPATHYLSLPPVAKLDATLSSASSGRAVSSELRRPLLHAHRN
ncbi:hypothetical protein NL676_009514 [Syzygium grande]|nr:hypothetical protein NL676_009514 [Syzygium grande]